MKAQQTLGFTCLSARKQSEFTLPTFHTKLVEEGAKDGVLISGEGLEPSSERLHIVYRGGERTVTEGPFTGPRSLSPALG